MFARQICRHLLRSKSGHVQNGQCLHTTSIRCLFESEILGIENYKRQRANTNDRIGHLQDIFRKRMLEHTQTSHNTIFTADLKNVVYSAASTEDLELAKKMITMFREQRGELRFSSFIFGPIVMRMCHFLNKPDLAYELFMMEPQSDGFFDQMSTFVVLMDLLFENGQYEKVMSVMQQVQDRQVAGTKFPTDCVTLFTAAACKLNTPEAFQAVLQLLEMLQKQQLTFSLRAINYTALLALKQGDPKTAMEVLGQMTTQSPARTPVSYMNMKVKTLTHLGRVKDAVLELQCLLNQDGPDSRVHDVFPDVVNNLEEAVEKQNDPELSQRMKEVRRGLEENSHLHTQTVEEHLFGTIVRRRQYQESYKSRRRSGAHGYSRDSGPERGSDSHGLRARRDL